MLQTIGYLTKEVLQSERDTMTIAGFVAYFNCHIFLSFGLLQSYGILFGIFKK